MTAMATTKAARVTGAGATMTTTMRAMTEPSPREEGNLGQQSNIKATSTARNVVATTARAMVVDGLR